MGSAAKPARNGAPTTNGVLGSRARPAPSLPRGLRDRADVSSLRPNQANGDSSLMNVLRSLESRLTRIEDELTQRPKNPEPNGRPPPLTDTTFSGAIQGQMLSDMLQLVSSNQMSGIFIIEDEMSSCTLYFDEGRICHAANGETIGEDAFFAAFALGSGRYHFKEASQLPPERTISAGTQYLVLEALRRMDEKQV
jgi:hypothetical protein